MIGTKKKIYSRKLSEKETYERGIAFRLRIVDNCNGIKRQARKNGMSEGISDLRKSMSKCHYITVSRGVNCQN